jgi:hypothetical protein
MAIFEATFLTLASPMPRQRCGWRRPCATRAIGVVNKIGGSS